MKTSEVNISISPDISVKGNLNIPENPQAFVIFSHGSGSSRFSPRNRFVAEILNKSSIATLLADLLSEEEDRIYKNRFNIGLLTERLVKVTEYVSEMPDLKNLEIGYFGASTGAASALKAAARLNTKIHAVVSRGGRPDLAMEELDKVKSPTLLIVGSLDHGVIELNEKALATLSCEKQLKIVPGATHLFEEPGRLEEVAHLATNWFTNHLIPHTFG